MMIVRDSFVDLRLGDCRDVLAAMPAASVDSIVCDPPYELGFMGKSWDSTGIANDRGMWAECLRVLKPGGHLLAFSGSRTYHRMACAIEDAGFEVRDQIMWIYGSGFPKSLDVSKAIDKAAGAEREVVGSKLGMPGYSLSETIADRNALSSRGLSSPERECAITAPATDAARQWAGYGTALKPAHEPVCMARKPLAGTVAANVQAHGTGALNIDACRVDGTARPLRISDASTANGTGTLHGGGIPNGSRAAGETTLGRWPANVMHDGSPEVLEGFPQTGMSAGGSRGAGGQNGRYRPIGAQPDVKPGFGDSGSAARFFYCAKVSKAERGAGNDHPTVKPLALMAYLVRLVTPPGGVVLDPFMGSGSTGRAACAEGRDFIGIERDPGYFEIARERIAGLSELETAA